VIEHIQIQQALNKLQASCVRFERNAHLGQPIRSAHIYGQAIDALATFIAIPTSTRADRYELGNIRSRVLFASKNGLVDRTALAQLLDDLSAQVDTATARVKAAR
jgi:hypothetical protein